MKTSIRRLFGSLHFSVVMLLLIILGVGAILLSATAPFDRIQNINQQKSLIENTLMLNKEDLEYSRIKVEGTIKRLPIMIEAMRDIQRFEFLNELYIDDNEERQKLLDIVAIRFESFAKHAQNYVSTKQSNHIRARSRLQNSVDHYILALQPLLTLETRALHHYFVLLIFGLSVLFAWAIYLLVVSRSASRIITKDIQNAIDQDATNKSFKYRTLEINSLALKLRQQGDETIVSAQKDPLTMLHNYEGIQKVYALRHTKTKGSHVHLCLFQIDNYQKLANHYPETILEPIILKIASILKLHKQQQDLIGRIGDSQFLAIFIRSDKTKALQDFEHIRQMVDENRFKLPHTSISVALSGGFATKSSSQTLDDAVKNTKEYLDIAVKKGGNTIAQLKDNTKIL